MKLVKNSMPNDNKNNNVGFPADGLVVVFIIIIIFAFYQRFSPSIVELLSIIRSSTGTSLFDYLHSLLLFILKIVAIISLAGIFFTTIRLNQIRGKARLKFADIETGEAGFSPNENVRWQRIIALSSSENPSDWRVAIIEADIILDDMVSRMGYPGKNLGERLKCIEPSDFLTLNDAWEAHKIRNMIAHGEGRTLTKREAKKAISLYEKVFKEFRYI